MKRKLFTFLSFSVGTQSVLALNQLVFLPIQIRMWGSSEAALWYSALALANLTTLSDLGMRMAGHTELLEAQSGTYQRQTTRDFAAIWAWVRILVALGTWLIIVADLATSYFVEHRPVQLWKELLISSAGVETFLIVRGMYLDTLGEYAVAEGSYFLLVSLRFLIGIPALLLFHAREEALTWIYCITVISALIIQSLRCREIRALRIFQKLPSDLNATTLSVIGATLSEPLVNWTRLSLPILILGRLSTPSVVTTFVGLRAVFGAGRAIVSQLSRITSVEFLRLYAAGRTILAETILAGATIACSFAGTCLSLAILLDNKRLFKAWLHVPLSLEFYELGLSFSITTALISSQVISGLKVKTGDLAQVAFAQWMFLLCSLTVAALALVLRLDRAYLLLLTIPEIIFAVVLMKAKSSNLRVRTAAGSYGLHSGALGVTLIVGLWFTIQSPRLTFLHGITAADAGWTAGFSALLFGVLVALTTYISRHLISQFLREANKL